MHTISGDAVKIFQQTPGSALIHQVNCQGVMGSGIAKQVKEEYPEHFDDYMDSIKHSAKYNKKPLGKITVTTVNGGRLLIGVFGQDSYGVGRHTNYAALSVGMSEAFTYLRSVGVHSKNVFMPYLVGCGHGGDWSVVYPILHDMTKFTNMPNVRLVKSEG